MYVRAFIVFCPNLGIFWWCPELLNFFLVVPGHLGTTISYGPAPKAKSVEKISKFAYSETSQDGHPLGNEKLAVLQRWPSYGGHSIKDS